MFAAARRWWAGFGAGAAQMLHGSEVVIPPARATDFAAALEPAAVQFRLAVVGVDEMIAALQRAGDQIRALGLLLADPLRDRRIARRQARRTGERFRVVLVRGRRAYVFEGGRRAA